MTSHQEVVITLRDIVNIIKRGKRTIIASAVGFALFTSWWTLTEPVKFLATGSFLEKETTQAGMPSHFSAALLGLGNNSSAATNFKSEAMLIELVKKFNMQGSISKTGRPGINWVFTDRILSNLKTAYYQYAYTSHPLFKDPIKEDIIITDIRYDDEVPYPAFYLIFEDEQKFIIKDGKDSYRGRLGDHISTDKFAFTIKSNGVKPNKGDMYQISLSPLDTVLKMLAGKLTVKSSPEDKNLIMITYNDGDRILATEVVNAVMDLYSASLKTQQQEMAHFQIDYLNKRKEEMNSIVQKMMREHAVKISSDLMTLGFPSVQSAMDFLSGKQAQYKQQSMMIDLEKMMLKKAKENGYSHYDNFTAHGDPGIINSILGQIRELSKQKDNIQLTMQKESSKDLTAFHLFIEELDTLKKNTDSAKNLLAVLEKDEIPNEIDISLENPKFIISEWLEQLRKAEQNVRISNGAGVEVRDNIKQQFTNYLQHMIRLLDVHTNIIHERMAQQQNPEVDYEGIELGVARELYVNLSRQLQDLEAQTLQHHFIVENIQDPDFEIGSLSSFLHDGISQQMIQQVSMLSLQLTDYNNRSIKEKDRIRSEIQQKKAFLISNLKHATQLLVLRQKLLKEKIRSLQETTLALIQQQISILEKHLSDYIDSRLMDLDNEYEVITQHQQTLNSQMSTLPLKWSDEKMIEQQMELNQSVAKEVARLIETKNLASNLELNRSAPFDHAYAPLKPVSPRLPLYIFIGVFMGTFLSVSTLFCKTLLRGVPASKENLIMSGFNYAGVLSNRVADLSKQPLSDQALGTLRSILAFLMTSEKGQSVLITEKADLKYARALAFLLSKRGFRVLYLDLSFDQPGDRSGLIAYVQGIVQRPEIINKGDYFEILTGGVSRFGPELISHPQFKKLVVQLQQEFDWIIASTEAPPLSGEVKELLPEFNYGVLLLKDETLQEVAAAGSFSNATFILATDGVL